MELGSSEEIAHAYFPFITVYKNGRVERHMLTSRVPPGLDPSTGSQSKDIVISPAINLSARIFIPKMMESSRRKMPLLIHYHGGGFCTGTAFCPILKYSLSNFVSIAQAVALTVDYRLAPEHPLPIAYEDSWDALNWVATHTQGQGPETWLNEHVDFGRVFLAGDSAGANIAHYVALQASSTRLDSMKIVGLSLVHPYFGFNGIDKLYRFLSPDSSATFDDPLLNPGVDPRLGSLNCDRVLVCVAGKDLLKARGLSYYETLKKSEFRGKVELVETDGEGHCFHLLNSSSPNCHPFLTKLASFMLEDS